MRVPVMTMSSPVGSSLEGVSDTCTVAVLRVGVSSTGVLCADAVLARAERGEPGSRNKHQPHRCGTKHFEPPPKTATSPHYVT
jgi:hypothetical protein